MKIGDYVRTRWGCIAKFEGIHEKFYEFDNIIMDESSAVREELFVDIVEKSSPNIIDLIEVGDYVNGMEVTRIGGTRWDENDLHCYCEHNGNENWKQVMIPAKDIKSIVTKEMFANAEYRVESN